MIEIIFLTISAVVSGFDGWEAIEDFGHAKLDWLRKYLPFKQGIPRHDTIARVISALSPEGVQRCFVSWVQSIAQITDSEIVAIDGKQARRSYDKKSRKAALFHYQVTFKVFQKEWADLTSLVCVVAVREINGEVQRETRYYISYLLPDAEKISHAIRCYWQVENSLHWVLDVTFGEDNSRIRPGYSAENMCVMRHLALNLIKKETKTKLSVPRKRRKANLYDEYREELLGI